MSTPSNKIMDVIRVFREELKNFYEKGEIETFIAYCFEEYLNLKRADIFLNFNSTISESDLAKFNSALEDLKLNKPIQYILGKADFYGLKFKVNQHVLIPRPETEELVQLIIRENQELRTKNGELSNLPSAISHFPSSISILDIGTGSGCISIALKKNIPSAKLYALDVSTEALNVAKKNAVLNNVDVEFFKHDILIANTLFESLNSGIQSKKLQNAAIKFDIIVSNPPYICSSEKRQMQKNVLEYEPHLALFVEEEEPLLFYEMIADFALKHLKQDGKLYFEINRNFGLEIKQMLENKGFKNVLLIKDLNANNRMTCCNI